MSTKWSLKVLLKRDKSLNGLRWIPTTLVKVEVSVAIPIFLPGKGLGDLLRIIL